MEISTDQMIELDDFYDLLDMDSPRPCFAVEIYRRFSVIQ